MSDDVRKHALFRVATAADMPGITRVRTSVKENHLSREQLDARGITEATVAASFERSSRGWVAIVDDRVVGFAIADNDARSLFALFIQPGFEGCGLGSELLNRAVNWLFDSGVGTIWLTTGRTTRAAEFYRRHGWIETGVAPNDQLRFELRKPTHECEP